MTQIKEFNNLDLMQTVRNNHLNPLIRRIETQIVPTMETLEHEVSETVKDVSLDVATNILKFDKGAGGFKEINLTPILPEFEGIGVEDEQGTGPGSGIKLLQLNDAKITRSGETAEVVYNWSKIVGDNQTLLQVGTLADGNKAAKYLFFKGANVTHTLGDIATVEIPVPPSQIMASLPGTPATAIKQIVLEGDTSSSNISNEKLTINLSSGGGTPLTTQNFLGFFESLGDLESFIKNPVDGKSFAFVKDSKLGGAYYTPYFYVNGSWKELKQDPALTYEDPKSPTTAGVFSIKPSDKITVDANGQLDLDGLSTPQLPSHFKGFFTSVDELSAAVPNPVVNQDWGYVRNANTGGLLAYRSSLKGTDKVWNIIAPLGSFAVVDSSVNPNNYKQAFGIYKDSNWDVDDKGILSLKSVDTSTEVEITDYAGQSTTGPITKIKFENGKSLVEVANKELTFNHPQRVVNYNSAWERAHATEDYRGNIFYDATSKCWMGWADPEQGGAVGAKWTRIAHADMSLEVKDLVRRIPAKAPPVIPGILGDSGNWLYNGVTYLDKTSEHLPEDLKNVCGGYITTSVQDADAPGITIPQHRIQTCTADRKEGGTWNRRFMSTGSPGADVEWSPWIRTSFSYKDIEDHMSNPGAHKSCIKFYKVTSFGAEYKTFYNQQEGGSAGGVRASNCSLIADNYGAIVQDQDYMQPAYDGRFKIRGVIGMAGYNDSKNLPTGGQWNIIVRLRHAGESSWSTLGHFRSEATLANTKKFPILGFSVDAMDMKKTDEIIINITHTSTQELVTNHPGLYFVPLRSSFILEDENTIAGSRIARTFGKYIGNQDVAQGVGLRVHHSNPADPKSTVRVYGESMPDAVTPMNRI